MITSTQLKAARMLLGWSSSDLAAKANVGVATVKRYEVAVGEISGNFHIVSAIIKCLEQAGIEFIGPENGEVGVKLVMGDDKS